MPVVNWIDSYISDPADLTCIDFYMEYLDGINLNIFISLLKKITSVKLENKKCIINWHYEEGDVDILDKGEYISSVLDIPLNIIKIDNPLIPRAIA